jgi:phenylacetate-CoA ligase
LEAAKREAIGRDVAHHIKSLIGVTAKIHVLGTDKIERTVVGKAKRVIDKRPK